MVFGFMKGSMEIKLPKHNYVPGETVKGQLTLELKKATKARKLTITLFGQEIVRRRVTDSRGTHYDNDYITLCDVTIPLDGEKEYKKGQWDFSVPIPTDVLSRNPRPEGTLGKVVDTMEFVSGTKRNIEWSMKANLDIPWGADVSKNQDIVIQESGGGGGQPKF
jgi:hypothetical protein